MAPKFMRLFDIKDRLCQCQLTLNDGGLVVACISDKELQDAIQRAHTFWVECLTSCRHDNFLEWLHRQFGIVLGLFVNGCVVHVPFSQCNAGADGAAVQLLGRAACKVMFAKLPLKVAAAAAGGCPPGRRRPVKSPQLVSGKPGKPFCIADRTFRKWLRESRRFTKCLTVVHVVLAATTGIPCTRPFSHICTVHRTMFKICCTFDSSILCEAAAMLFGSEAMKPVPPAASAAPAAESGIVINIRNSARTKPRARSESAPRPQTPRAPTPRFEPTKLSDSEKYLRAYVMVLADQLARECETNGASSYQNYIQKLRTEKDKFRFAAQYFINLYDSKTLGMPCLTEKLIKRLKLHFSNR